MALQTPCITCFEVGPHVRGCGQSGPHRLDGPYMVGHYWDREGRQVGHYWDREGRQRVETTNHPLSSLEREALAQGRETL